jgi:glycosyltransferase involved in cell wall biosynthesis
MVLGSDGLIQSSNGFIQANIWAKRQIESLEAIGIIVETYHFGERRSLRGLLRGGCALHRRVLEFKPDIVHVHYASVQALIAVLFARRPVVITLCGSDLLGNYNSYGKKTWSGVLSSCLSQLAALGASRCIAVSEELRNCLWLRWYRNKCDVIPCGVDLSLFKPIPRSQARAALGWTHNDPVILFILREGAWVKDPKLAIAAHNEARRRLNSLRMVVLRNEDPSKIPLFLNASDVLLLTSRHEGSNNSVKEALACNLPVVATRCGDTEERLQGVRWSYICKRDSRELAQRLLEVVTSGERSNGREYLNDLTIDRVAQKVKVCYKRVLSATQRISSGRNLDETI